MTEFYSSINKINILTTSNYNNVQHFLGGGGGGGRGAFASLAITLIQKTDVTA